MKSKKGYTLSELAVAMAVSAVIMSLVVMFCMSINTYIQTKKTLTAVNQEVEVAEDLINRFLEQYQSSEYNFTISTDCKVLNVFQLVEGNEELKNTITLKSGELFAGGESLWQFENISSANFYLTESLIKCKLLYNENNEFNLIFNKRV